MRKLGTYLIIFMLFATGILSLYRVFLNPKHFHKIEAKVLRKNLEMVSTRSKSYALTLTIADYRNRIGIYLGTEQQAKADETLRLIDIGKTYIFLLDPTVETSNGINLGVREIYFNKISVYKYSSIFNLIIGIFCIVLSSFIAFAVKNKGAVLIISANCDTLK